jgi:hypothetical protein
MIVSFPLFSESASLIDFTILTADSDIDGNGVNDENEKTLINFADKAGTSFTEEEKQYMQTSLAISNWEVELASSSRTVMNQGMSYVLPAPVKQDASAYGGDTVLGARIHFPTDPFNSYAIIRPPFEIPAYQPIDENDMYGSKFDSYGVVKNVGVLKTLSINVLGRNFPNGLGIILKDQNNVEKIVFMNYLEFDGWKTLTWNNPNYISDVRNREMKRYPLYPKAAPFYKLTGIIVYKDAAQEGGDFVTYIRDISMTFDKAVLSLESDIDDEALWGILGDREATRRTAEFERLGARQVLRYLERQKMHVDETE